MATIVQDLGAILRAGLKPLDEPAMAAARADGATLMGVTDPVTEVAVACGWDGVASLFVLTAGAKERLATAFREDDSTAAAWFERPSQPGVIRIFFVTPDSANVVFATWRSGEKAPAIDHTSGIDWEPVFWESTKGGAS